MGALGLTRGQRASAKPAPAKADHTLPGGAGQASSHLHPFVEHARLVGRGSDFQPLADDPKRQ